MRRVPALGLVFSILVVAALPASAANFSWRGLLDVTAPSNGDAFQANTLTRGDNPFDPYGLRLFIDGTVNDQFTVFGQVVLHDRSGVYLDGAYVMWTPWSGQDFHLNAGKLPWLIGTYAPRTYSDKNPLIGKPLMYQYHTTLVWFMTPPNADKLLASRGTGQSGIGYLGGSMMGMALVDDSWWDTGVMANGSSHSIEYSLGMTNGTPGWGNSGQDENHGKTVLGRIGLAPTPWLRLGASGALGPYLVHDLKSPLPPGKVPEDYDQQLVMGDLEVTQGHVELRGEAAANTWQTPNLGNLDTKSGYVEGKVTLGARLWAAGRYDVMRFSDIADSNGVHRPWDFNQDRIEGGLGLRWDRNVLLKAVFQRNTQHEEGEDYRSDLYALQLTVLF
jgi:hypothetical protein